MLTWYCDQCCLIFRDVLSTCPVCNYNTKLDLSHDSSYYLNKGFSYYVDQFESQSNSNDTPKHGTNTAENHIGCSEPTESQIDPQLVPPITNGESPSVAASQNPAQKTHQERGTQNFDKQHTENLTANKDLSPYYDLKNDDSINQHPQISFEPLNTDASKRKKKNSVSHKIEVENIPWRTILTILLVLIIISIIAFSVYFIWIYRERIVFALCVLCVILGLLAYARIRLRRWRF